MHMLFVLRVCFDKKYIMSHMLTIMTLSIIVFVDACGDNKPRVMGAEFEELLYLESPDYPLPYPNDADCQWLVTADPGFTIQLTFIEYDVEV